MPLSHKSDSFCKLFTSAHTVATEGCCLWDQANPFGTFFEQTAQRVGAEYQHDGFSASVIKVCAVTCHSHVHLTDHAFKKKRCRIIYSTVPGLAF